MRLINIKLSGNEKTGLRKDTIYATLVDDGGSIVISATLEYVLTAIRERGYEVEGVTVNKHTARGSTVRLDKY